MTAVPAFAVAPRLADLAGAGVPQHTVVCLFNGMGDAFLALPVIRFIIANFGRDRVSVWANRYHGMTVYAELSDVLVASSECNQNLAAARKEEEFAALRRVLTPGCALNWVSLNSYAPRTEVEDHAIGGLKPQFLWEFRGAHVRTDAATGAAVHRIDQYFRVIGERCMAEVERRPLIDEGLCPRAAEIRDHVHRLGKRLIVVHAQTRSNKCWPDACWRELGALLRMECELVVLGLPGQPLSCADGYLAAPPDWAKQVALLAYADTFIGVDSCFAHIADACNVPGLVLHGDIDLVPSWGPKGPMLEALVASEGNLANITPAAVAERVKRAWSVRQTTASTVNARVVT